VTIRQRCALWLAIGLFAGCLGVAFLPPAAHAQTRDDVITMINVSADRNHVDPDAMGRILWCESRWQADVRAWDGSQGIAQFQQGTWGWASRDAGWAGYTPYHAEAAIDTMAWLLARGEWFHWRACW
jgi:hypothetical protein